MNSSVPRAADSRAEAAQSIASMSSPRTYGREPATSVPTPRRPPWHRAERQPDQPTARDEGKDRRRGRSSGRGLLVIRLEDARRRRDAARARRAELGQRDVPAGAPGVRERLRREDDPVTEDRQEEVLDVDRGDVRAVVEERPARARRARARGSRGRTRRPPPRASRGSRARARRSSARAAGRGRRRAPRPRAARPPRPSRPARASASGWCSRWSSMISSSSSSDGYPSEVFRKKRSSCASGSGKVPSYSIGFSVARSRNGLGSRRVSAVRRHLLLGHRLEQRGLGLRHRAVDLVDEHDVREDRPGLELELPDLLVVDREAGDVVRLQVGRALDPGRDRALDRLGDRPGEHGLRGARHVLEEHVAAARERAEDEPDLLASCRGRRSRCSRGAARRSRRRARPAPPRPPRPRRSQPERSEPRRRTTASPPALRRPAARAA